MLTALKLYEGVLYELQKEESPAFGLDTFNHFVMMAVDELVREAERAYETTQPSSDYLRCLVKKKVHTYANDAPAVAHEIDLPDDYYALKLATITFEYTRNTVCGERKKRQTVPLRKATADLRGVQLINYYSRPSLRQAFYSLRENVMDVHLPTLPGIVIRQIELEYLKTVVPLTLLDGHLENAGVDESPQSPFPLHVDQDLIRRTARLFYKNTDDITRLQTQRV